MMINNQYEIEDMVRQHNETAQNLINHKWADDTQHAHILAILQRGESLTGLEALQRVGTMKLASRISELRKAGYNIKDEKVHNETTGKHYKRYFMA